MATALAFPEFWWLRWISLVPLFLAIRFLTNAPAAICGSIWGLSLFAFARLEYGSGVVPSGWLLLSIVPAAFAWFAVEWTKRKGFHPLVLALSWVVAEYLLGPRVTDHGFLASTRGDGLIAPMFEQIAGGWLLTAFVLAAINATLVSALLEIEKSLTRGPTIDVSVELGCWLEILSVPLPPERLVASGQPRAPPS